VITLKHNLTYGCNIGYGGPELDQISNNLQSVHHEPTILDAAIATKCQAQQILGLLAHAHSPISVPLVLV